VVLAVIKDKKDIVDKAQELRDIFKETDFPEDFKYVDQLYQQAKKV
jgi:cell fate (sporulation/competence/biofilm development) regulator YmcA (YheA/YmcA/DUF963 family)